MYRHIVRPSKWFTALISFYLFSCTQCLYAQESALMDDEFAGYKTGQHYFDQSLYEAARVSLAGFLQSQRHAAQPHHQRLMDEADIMYHIAGLRLGLEESEEALKTAALAKLPDPVAYPAITDLGSHYYNKKQYKSAVQTYDLIPLDNLSPAEMAEARFKKGYCYFVMRNFTAARSELVKVKDMDSDYYSAINYYLALSDYFLKNYNDAASGFSKIANDPEYRAYIPYYLCQLYFATGKYDKVIETGENALKISDLQNRKEVRLLIGQAYFELKEYAKALPHLEYYEANTDKLTVEEFYQLAFTQHQEKKYAEAIKNFNAISLSESALGQSANFYLADAYLKSGDKLSARTAFKNAAGMKYDRQMSREAQYFYGKLSAELGQEREAVTALSDPEIPAQHRKEADDIIYHLLSNSTDYEFVLQYTDQLKSPEDRLKPVHQRAAINRAMQWYRDGNPDQAYATLERSERYKTDRNLNAVAQFWKAQILHEKEQYPTSIPAFEKYFEMSNGLNGLPEESRPFMAHYSQGYNYLALKNYKDAERSFKNCITGFNLNKGSIKNKQLTDQIFPDALMRTGDCLFKNRNYAEALQFYKQAIATRSGNYVYAKYQKAMIEGLTGEPYEKILTLNELKKSHPQSEYVDDALMHLGDTYFSLGNVDNAYASFTELVNNFKGKSPLVASAYIKMGLIAYNRGDLQTAIKNYKEVFNNNPDAKERQSALLGLEEIYINDMGKPDEYIKFAEQVQGQKVSEFAADSLSFRVGEVRYQNGEYEKAITGFEQYLRQYPNGFYKLQAHYLKAESHTILRQYNDALTHYEMVIKAGTGPYYEASVRKSALISYNHSQDFAKALKYYELFYEISKTPADRYQAALGALRSAFRLSNDDSVTKYANIIISTTDAPKEELSAAHYYLAKVAFRKKDYDTALKSFETTAGMSNNNQAAESRYMIAEIYYLKGDRNKAEAQCNAANKLNGQYPYWIARSLLLLSDIYYDRNDLFNARAAIEAVLENFKEDEGLLQTAREKLKRVEAKEQESNRIRLKTDTGVLPMQPRKG